MPDRPAAPTLLAVADDPSAPTSGTITLELHAPTATGGADIAAYELLIDDGAVNTASVALGSYSGCLSCLSHTIKASDTGTAFRGLLPDNSDSSM